MVRHQSINLLDLAGRLIGEPSATGAIAVRPLPDASRYGVVEIENGDSRDFAIAPRAREADWSALESMSFGAP